MSIFSFMFEFARSPRSIGGIIPSSSGLSDAIRSVAAPYLGAGGTIIEVGAGTGAITQSLVELNCPLIALEPNARFRTQFEKKFPEIKVLPYTLQEAEPLIQKELKAQCLVIVSSLPLVSFKEEVKREIRNTFTRLLSQNPSAVLIQYTYRSGDPLSLQNSRIISSLEKSVRINIPPAHVWSYRLIPDSNAQL